MVPLAESASDFTAALCPLSCPLSTHSRDSLSFVTAAAQNRIVLFRPAVTSTEPSVDHTMAVTHWSSLQMRTSTPVSTSHRRTESAPPPAASVRPLGEYAKHKIRSPCRQLADPSRVTAPL